MSAPTMSMYAVGVAMREDRALFAVLQRAEYGSELYARTDAQLHKRSECRRIARYGLHSSAYYSCRAPRSRAPTPPD